MIWLSPRCERPSLGIGDWVFAVSPDGSPVAFVRYGMPGISDVYVAPIAGGEPRRRTNWTASTSGVSWASDGREILYSVAEAPGLDHSLFRIPADGDRIERGTGPSTPVWPACRCPSPIGSARPNRVHQESQGCRSSPRRSRGSTGWRRLSGYRPLFRFHARGLSGPVLRDGKQVAFLSDRTGWAEVLIANADGSGLRQATTLHATELLIGGWSPDSRRIGSNPIRSLVGNLRWHRLLTVGADADEIDFYGCGDREVRRLERSRLGHRKSPASAD